MKLIKHYWWNPGITKCGRPGGVFAKTAESWRGVTCIMCIRLKPKPRKKRKFGIECPVCKERLFSWHVHDFHYCKGKHVFIDGGWEYLRYSYTKDNQKPRVIYCTSRDVRPK